MPAALLFCTSFCFHRHMKIVVGMVGDLSVVGTPVLVAHDKLFHRQNTMQYFLIPST